MIRRPTTASACSTRSKTSSTAPRSFLQKAIDLRPDYRRGLNNLGVLYVREQDYAKAEAAIQELHSRHSELRSGLSQPRAPLRDAERQGEGKSGAAGPAARCSPKRKRQTGDGRVELNALIAMDPRLYNRNHSMNLPRRRFLGSSLVHAQRHADGGARHAALAWKDPPCCKPRHRNSGSLSRPVCGCGPAGRPE